MPFMLPSKHLAVSEHKRKQVDVESKCIDVVTNVGKFRLGCWYNIISDREALL